MRFLCSNDDGIFAHGLDCLIKVAETFGDVTVVAPDREQSATSHSLTLHHPLRPVHLGHNRYQVDGTPTDCVMLGVEAIMSERPDFVLSGINHGQNMGEDVLYSGTVAAAMEGLMLGIPSIAFSFAGGDMRADPELLSRLHDPLKRLLEQILNLPSFPKDTLLNVNFPPLFGDDIKGVRLTRLGRRVFANSIKPMSDPWGRPIYWIGAGSMSWSGGEDSDYRAVADGYISVTPLHLDLTNQSVLDTSAEWWQIP
jgi:5'-nucleotidase